MYSYLKDSLNVNSQSSIIQAILVGNKWRGASIMPSLRSPANTSTIDNSNLEPEKKIKFTPDYNEKEPVFWRTFFE
jgi:hypothetical protein